MSAESRQMSWLWFFQTPSDVFFRDLIITVLNRTYGTEAAMVHHLIVYGLCDIPAMRSSE